jgi:uncharacterized protein (DUF2252 family)
MKNIIILAFVISLSGIAYSQSLVITKTDQSILSFKLADVDSITFSVTSLGKSSDLSDEDISKTISVTEESSVVNNSVDKLTNKNSKQIVQEGLEKSTSGSMIYYKKE